MDIEQDDSNWLDPVKCTGNAVELGYQKCECENGTSFSAEEVQERQAIVAPFSPQPVEGGFVPLNNIYERI